MYKAVARIAGSSVAVNGDGSKNLPKDRMAVASCQAAEHGSNCVGQGRSEIMWILWQEFPYRYCPLLYMALIMSLVLITRVLDPF